MVETKVVGSGGVESFEVPVPAGTTTLRALIEVLVRYEVAAYEERRRAGRVLQVLTPADLARGSASGSYGREVRAVPEAPSVDDALARAVEAFGDGLYFVFVDDMQVEQVDAPLTLRDDSALRLVRLVALAGG